MRVKRSSGVPGPRSARASRSASSVKPRSGREALLEEVAERGFTELAERLARALRGPGTPLERFTRRRGGPRRPG
jgi:hypothetical protein